MRPLPTLHSHDRPTFFSRPDRLHEPLYVVSPVYNPIRYRSRWRLYEDFEKHVYESGALLYTVECAFGDRDHVVTHAENPQHIQVRTHHELWLKENMINVGVARLPADWKYVAWVDADVHFARPDWADETRHLLQHYPMVQMFSQYQDLTPNHESLGPWKSFAHVWTTYGDHPPKDLIQQSHYGTSRRRRPPGYPGAPGLAWACTRDAWDNLGGLMDWCILGSGDWLMAHSLIGQLERSVRRGYHPRYVQKMLVWQDRALRHIKRNFGVMSGLILHNWHGPKRARGYRTRDEILVKNRYNPDQDVKYDSQGILQLEDVKWQLRDDLRAYFRSRSEDSIDP